MARVTDTNDHVINNRGVSNPGINQPTLAPNSRTLDASGDMVCTALDSVNNPFDQSLESDCVTTAKHPPSCSSSLDASFLSSIPKTGLENELPQQTLGQYYDVSSTEQRLSQLGASSTTALWDPPQQQLWSKSVHHLDSSLDSLAVTLPSILAQQSSTGSAGDSRSGDALLDYLSAFDQSDSTSVFNPTTTAIIAAGVSLATTITATTTNSTYPISVDEERGLHQPDGADHPDEHMWLYEDPQGRTQGSFSDAQMNEWLLAGIYFTPTLRIRRKCDENYSTLADYTRLFGRIPFIVGLRVSPIRGGIMDASMQCSLAGQSNMPTSINTATADHYASSASALLSDHCMGNGGVTGQNALDATVSLHGGGRAPSLPSHRTAVPYQSDYATNLAPGSHPRPNGAEDCTLSNSAVSSVRTMRSNSKLPVLPSRNPGNAVSCGVDLNHSLSGLHVNNCQSQEVTDPLLLASQPVTSTSTLMALASLVSMNPTLASLASLSLTGASGGGGGGGGPSSIDLGLSNGDPTPGLLNALAQYLNIQPHASGHQTASPMQQLAETAQLAAQLAALAGAHSPDQTPMQPAQALALAQLVMSQCSTPQWTAQFKKDMSSDVGYEAATLDRRGEKMLHSDGLDRFLPQHSTLATAVPSGDGTDAEASTHWPTPSAAGGSRLSPHTMDRRMHNDKLSPDYASQQQHQLLQQHQSHEAFAMGSTDRLRDGQSCPTSGTTRYPQAPGKSRTATQPANARNGKSKAVSGTFESSHPPTTSSVAGQPCPQWLWSSSGAPETVDRDATGHQQASSMQRPHSSDTGPWAAKQTPGKSSTRTGAIENGLSGTRSSASTVSATGANAAQQRMTSTQSKTQVASMTVPTSRSPAKGSSSATSTASATTITPTKETSKLSGSNVMDKAAGRSIATSRKANPTMITMGSGGMATLMTTGLVCPAATAASSSSSTIESQLSAEEELARLTQWCQTRLSSMPMREKVDIPTVVELLATLDAPYEVERMVQTVLGESARANLFVKEFLDRRRPFWQLHRERRENESLVQQQQTQQQTTVQSNSSNGQSTPRSTDKKKRSAQCGSQDGQRQNGAPVVSNGGSNGSASGGLSWIKVSGASQTTPQQQQTQQQQDPSQDNQWHHIKPKGSHNRKVKKDKAP